MRPLHVWAFGLAVLVAACPSHLGPKATSPARPGQANAALQGIQAEPQPSLADRQAIRHAAGNLASAVRQLQAPHGPGASGAGQPAGDLWIEVGRLKRGGQNVRAIEWYVSDLERNLQSGQPNASARRHMLNNLNYEIEALKRRHR